MATMNVLDSAGATVAIEKPLAPGQATMAASRPVAIASDQSPIAVIGFTAVVAATIVRPADTTAYALGDLIAASTVAATVNGAASSLPLARINGGTGLIRRVRLSTSKTGLAGTEQFRVHFFKTAPTVANGDNGALSVNGVAAVHIGHVDITLDRVFSDGAKGIGVPAAGAEICFDAAAGSTAIYFLLEARGAYTPAAGETFTVAAEVLRD